jgi:integrase/recombinase XerC
MTSQTPIAPEVAAEIAGWLSFLGAEKRMSPKTLEAYARDVGQFLDFLTGHLGGAPTLKQLAKLTPADVRAFMAARRSDGAGNRTLMRVLAGARSFARFLERNGKGKVGALAAVRSPKLPRTLPKPLSIATAKRIADTDLRAGEAREPWIIARDAAVLGLLYGCGLRIAEALSLKRKDLPTGDSLTVTGKGNKTRMVPVLPQVARLIADYVALCPSNGGRPSSSARAAGHSAASCSGDGACAALACRTARRRMHAPLFPTVAVMRR